MPGRCPHCGTRIKGLEAAGPGLHAVGPCGHFVDKTELRAVLDGSAARRNPGSRQRRTSIQDADGKGILIPDGGTTPRRVRAEFGLARSARGERIHIVRGGLRSVQQLDADDHGPFGLCRGLKRPVAADHEAFDEDHCRNCLHFAIRLGLLDDWLDAGEHSNRDAVPLTDGGPPPAEDNESTVTVGVELTKPVAEQIVAAAALMGESPSEFIDDAILGRLQSVDNILHEETHIDLPPDFDPRGLAGAVPEHPEA